jgi:C-terminal processing protease CtpA/Prc
MTIRGLNVTGLLGARTTIRVGDIVESINDIPSAVLNPQEATSMIRAIPDWVHILVRVGPSRFNSLAEPITQNVEVQVAPCDANDDALQDTTTEAVEIPHLLDFNDRDDMDDPSLLSLTMYKMKKTDKIGLSLVKLDDGIYINKVSGYLAGSILKEGMALLAINHKLTARMTLVEATTYLRDRVGSITFLARNPHGNPKYVQAMVFKKSLESTDQNFVGISFKGASGRQLKICEIRADGLFVESCLNAGDSVLRINETPCRHARPKDAVDLVRGSPAAVSILAKSKSKNAIVIARVSSRSGSGLRSNFVVPRSA